MITADMGAAVLVLVAAVAGFAFSAVSTHDFVEHLDRQVHSIHCSFVPGLGNDATGSSGCHVTMMSPYSSILRESFWGGLPISLPAMSVFAFIACWTTVLLVQKRTNDRRMTQVLFVSTFVPVIASLVMGYLAFAKLDAACKLCIGIYISSLLVCIGAFLMMRHARRSGPVSRMELERQQTVEVSNPSASGAAWGIGVFLLAVFVAVPAAAYVALAPDHDPYLGRCGELERPQGLDKIAIDVGGSIRGRDAVEVFDPLCPACRAFEERLDASDLGEQLRRRLVLFPLDSECNWMVEQAVHPGACAISEAILCAGRDAPLVVKWAFEHQTEIRESATNSKDAAARMAKAEFPSLASCIGSASAKASLNRSLRWAVSNHLPVLTPQLYVDGQKLCDEDTDLGMEYALAQLLKKGGTR